jgi:fumarate reductase subunit C
MSRYEPSLKTFPQPTRGAWWKGNSFLTGYMVREWSSLLIVLYALVLVWGLWSLSNGEAAYGHWRAAMASPLFILFHIVALGVVAYHSYTWFKVMPKTMPNLPFDASLFTKGGWAAVVIIFVLGLIIINWVA